MVVTRRPFGISACLVIGCIAVVLAGDPGRVCSNGLKDKADPNQFPEKVLALVNDFGQICARAHRMETAIYYAGDCKGLNRFLKKLSALRGAFYMECVFMYDDGGGEKRSGTASVGKNRGGEPPVRPDWHMHVFKERVKDMETLRWSVQWVVSVVIPVKGGVKIEDVELPITFRAKVGGRVSEFVEKHNTRRDAMEGTTNDGESAKATTFRMIERDSSSGHFELPEGGDERNGNQ